MEYVTFEQLLGCLDDFPISCLKDLSVSQIYKINDKIAKMHSAIYSELKTRVVRGEVENFYTASDNKVLRKLKDFKSTSFNVKKTKTQF